MEAKTATQTSLSSLTTIGVLGSSGRMGQAIKRLLVQDHAHEARLDIEINRTYQGEFLSDAVKLDVLIDVSLPEPCEMRLKELLSLGEQMHLPSVVIGSTGWSASQLKTIDAYSKRAPILMSANFSPAINLFLGLLEQISPRMKAWGYDVSLFESHHKKKLDSPSGTAKALLSKIEAADLKPQVSCVRAGNIVGTHQVSFVGPQDIFEIRHEALDRDLFAKGAILAALWLDRQLEQGQITPGKYQMKDVIFGRS